MTSIAARSLRQARGLAEPLGLAVLCSFSAYALIALLDSVPSDFHVYLRAAKDISEGQSPYPRLEDWALVQGRAYVYPPLTALAALPLTLVPVSAADVVVKVALVAALGATLAVLGVRDWRCYAVALAWPPVVSTLQTGQLTIPLALAAAVVWRYRDRSRIAGVTAGASVAAKLLLWPLVVWLAASGRRRGAAIACVSAFSLLLLSWAAIGFAGLADYPELLRQERDFAESKSYTVMALLGQLGAGAGVAWSVGLLTAAALLAAAVVTARRGEDERAFTFAISATIACTPVVWLHYFTLLLVPVAIVRPRLSPLWFVPLVVWVVSPEVGSATLHETGGTLALMALTMLLVVQAAPRGGRQPAARSSGRSRTAMSSSS